MTMHSLGGHEDDDVGVAQASFADNGTSQYDRKGNPNYLLIQTPTFVVSNEPLESLRPAGIPRIALT